MFSFLFKKKQTETDESVGVTKVEASNMAPGTTIRFDPKLVAELKMDHVNLIALFKGIAATSGRHDSELLTKQLADFGSSLRGHILKENVRLYVYLKSSLKTEEDSLTIMQEFSHEMNLIGRAVNNFLHKYTNVAQWDEPQWAVFERDLNEVGTVLTQRIETEENILYPLYMPAGSYH